MSVLKKNKKNIYIVRGLYRSIIYLENSHDYKVIYGILIAPVLNERGKRKIEQVQQTEYIYIYIYIIRNIADINAVRSCITNTKDTILNSMKNCLKNRTINSTLIRVYFAS